MLAIIQGHVQGLLQSMSLHRSVDSHVRSYTKNYFLLIDGAVIARSAEDIIVPSSHTEHHGSPGFNWSKQKRDDRRHLFSLYQHSFDRSCSFQSTEVGGQCKKISNDLPDNSISYIKNRMRDVRSYVDLSARRLRSPISRQFT